MAFLLQIESSNSLYINKPVCIKGKKTSVCKHLMVTLFVCRGRYDLRRTPAENINLPPALLSRFDLLWLILDRADMDSDLEMARHIVYVHQNKESPALGFTPLDPSVLRYISLLLLL